MPSFRVVIFVREVHPKRAELLVMVREIDVRQEMHEVETGVAVHHRLLSTPWPSQGSGRGTHRHVQGEISMTDTDRSRPAAGRTDTPFLPHRQLMPLNVCYY